MEIIEDILEKDIELQQNLGKLELEIEPQQETIYDSQEDSEFETDNDESAIVTEDAPKKHKLLSAQDILAIHAFVKLH